MTTDSTIYHLTDTNGHHHYMLPSPGYGRTWLGDGQPLKRVRDAGYSAGWYSTDAEVAQLAKQLPDKTTVTGYRLRDPDAASAKYPAELTVIDYNERTDDGDDEDAPEVRLYERITMTEPGQVEPVDVGAIMHLEGKPAPANDGWVAELPHAFANHVELRHLFPGHFVGFERAVANAVNERLGGTERWGRRKNAGTGGCEVEKDGTVQAWMHVPYSPPQTYFEHDMRNGRKLKSGHTYQKTETFSIRIKVGHHVAGKNRAEAAVKWHEMLPKLVDQIVAKLEPAVCWHCKGKGVVSAADVPDDVEPEPVGGPLRDFAAWAAGLGNDADVSEIVDRAILALAKDDRL